MGKFSIKNPKKIGESPGTLVHIGHKFKEQSEITLIEYDKDSEKQYNINNIEEAFVREEQENIKWLNIEGLDDIELIEKIGQKFNLHPLMLEDILNTNQRPKIDDYDSYMFIILKVLIYDKTIKDIKSEQVSFVFINNYVISFQERNLGIFDNIKLRIKASKGNIRKLGADYLLYALIDAVVDSYFEILENIGDKIDEKKMFL